MSLITPIRLFLSEQKILTMMNGDSDSPVYATTPNAKPAKQVWVLHRQEDGGILLQNELFRKYIGVATALHPNVTVVATDSAIKFIMKPTGKDSYRLYVENGAEKLYLYLAPDWDYSPKAALVREEDAKHDWHMEPAA
ncbi:hypothetical protein FRC06_005214 [Ceratobasidium sp. 370]|nr:hypothetical protein FRC06_005214 [Ceratobasidium sp. 370]